MPAMRILFIRPYPVLPELFAGTEVNLHWLCRAFVANGYEAVVAAKTGATAGTVDHQCGYPVVRAPNFLAAINYAATQYQPDVCVVTQPSQWLGMAPAIRDLPIVIYEQEISTGLKFVPAGLRARAVYIANSVATAEHLSRAFGIASTVIPPLFGVDRYVGIRRQGESVLFVSLQHRKGADVSIQIAQSRPKVPFIFVESWTEDPADTQMLRELVKAIPNITLLPNQCELTHIMPKIRLLLMPSRSKEAWGRTATEAQICGIPVLGSSRGNLPKTIGPGGITLDPDDPVAHWLAAFDSLIDDPSVFEKLSRNALEQGRLMIQESERALQTFERILRSVVARSRA
jgi:glycosyltransferase involved in cell wall biosynthesis